MHRGPRPTVMGTRSALTAYHPAAEHRYRVGGLDYLLKRSDIDMDATGKAAHPA